MIIRPKYLEIFKIKQIFLLFQGGYATNQELCMSYILYYPRTALAGCSSMTPVDFFFHKFGVTEFYHHSIEEIEKILLKLTDKQ